MKNIIANNPSESVPKHEQLRTYLLTELQEGRLKPGDSLPTELALAESTRISRSTVRQALAGLERSGLIRRIRGRGTFIHEDARTRIRSGLDLYALLIPETRGGFYPSLQRGFSEAAADGQNQVIVSDTDNDPLRQADVILQLIDKSVAGVAIVPTTITPTPSHQLRPLQDRNIPVVFCHRRVEGVQAPLVTYPHIEVGRLAGRSLAELGHRRVALFGSHRSGLGPVYEQGLRESIQQAGGDLPDDFVRFGKSGKMTPEHEAFVLQSLQGMMARKDRPTGIFCGFDSEAELIYLLLGRLGIRVPDDVSLVGFGGSWREGAITCRLVSVTLDEEQLGRHAVNYLNEMRHGERALNDMSETVMPLSLCNGETLGPAPKSTRPITTSS